MSLEEKLKSLPTDPGVYIHKNSDGKIIYIGKAKSLRNRVRQYFQSSRNMDPKTRELVKRIADFEFIVVDTETEAISAQVHLGEIASFLANYNLLAVPVVDENRRLLGAVSVDDVLDHMLPADWRKNAQEKLDNLSGNVEVNRG